MDQTSLLPRWLPAKLRRRINQRLLELIVGSAEDHGLPKPDHGLGEAHPTISSEFLSLVQNSRIHPKPGVSELCAPNEVCFSDGSSTLADAVVYCTGYSVSFPFFAPDFVAAPDNDLPLFMRVHSPSIDGLFFVGLCQTLGAVFPVAEAQAEWIAGQLAGDYQLPTRAEMQAHIAQERRKLERRYVHSRRHTMQLDADEYLADLARERARGAKRRMQSHV